MNDSRKLTAIHARGEVMHGERTPGTLLLEGSTVTFRPASEKAAIVLQINDITRIEPSPYGFSIITNKERYYFITIPLVNAQNATVSPYFFGLAWASRRKSGTKQWLRQLKELGVATSARGYIRFYARLIFFYALFVALGIWLAMLIFNR